MSLLRLRWERLVWDGLRLGTFQTGGLDVAGGLQGVKGGRSHA